MVSVIHCEDENKTLLYRIPLAYKRMLFNILYFRVYLQIIWVIFGNILTFS